MRRRADLSQEKLAQLVMVHLSSISRWERDQATREMAIKHFVKIAAATKTPVEILLAFQKERQA